MISLLRPNLVLRGHWPKATYTAIRQIRPECPNVWLGRSNDDQQHVILKEAHQSYFFDTEAKALKGYLRGHSSFRQLVNLIPDQKIMVFEYLADNLHNVIFTRPKRRLEKEEVKRVTKVILKGLVTMHEEGVAHTDIKPDNIVVDFDQQGKFSRIKVIDLGDSIKIEPTTQHPFTHATYRAPEGVFEIPWTTKVDLWGLGTLIMQGLTGASWFSPVGIDEEDETYLVMVLALQCGYFGPFPDKYVELAEGITTEHFHHLEKLVTQKGGRRKFRRTLAVDFCEETVAFLDRVMKLDQRDRPSAQDLLQDQWLSDVTD